MLKKKKKFKNITRCLLILLKVFKFKFKKNALKCWASSKLSDTIQIFSIISKTQKQMIKKTNKKIQKNDV